MMIAMTISFAAFAQNKDVTTFLGIPVDGTVSNMKQKLVSKGFVPKKVGTNEFLEGEFNGCNVNVYIRTNNNKVYRIMVADNNTVDVHNKSYEALFYQVPNMEKADTLALQKKVLNELLSKYTEAELINPSEETKKEIKNTAIKIGTELMLMKPVWFKIVRVNGEYYICMFYDNEYNHANGEDL